MAGATFKNPLDCVGMDPVHVLQIHGTSDSTILYAGGSILGSQYPGAVETTQMWAMRNGCDPTTTVENNALDLVSNISGNETSITRYPSGCIPGGSTELWTVQGGSHIPAISISFAPSVVEFLLAHPKDGVDAVRYCSPAAPNSTGVPSRMDASGSDVLVDNALTLEASDLPLNSFGFFLASQSEGLYMPPGSQGSLCLGGAIGRFNTIILNSGSTGTIELLVDLGNIPNNPPVTAVVGDVWRFQAWHRDINPQNTSNFTDAIAVTIR
jgi:hypothetical protein